MKKSKISEVPKESAASKLFTSEDVYRQPLAPDSTDFNASVVGFGHGVRNKFHTHSSDQLLIVTSGQGLFVTESEKAELEPGDVIFSPAARSTGTERTASTTSRTSPSLARTASPRSWRSSAGGPLANA